MAMRSLPGPSVSVRASSPMCRKPMWRPSRSTVVLMGRTAHGNLFHRPTPKDREVAAAVLDHLGIARLSERPYTMISGGERQLVLLARALAQEPRFGVLDEPTASLDFGNQGKVMREIRALAAAGHGVLFTTHAPNHALRAADGAYLLRPRVVPRAARGALPGAGRGFDRRHDRLECLFAGMNVARCRPRVRAWAPIVSRASAASALARAGRDP